MARYRLLHNIDADNGRFHKAQTVVDGTEFGEAELRQYIRDRAVVRVDDNTKTTSEIEAEIEKERAERETTRAKARAKKGEKGGDA